MDFLVSEPPVNKPGFLRPVKGPLSLEAVMPPVALLFWHFVLSYSVRFNCGQTKSLGARPGLGRLVFAPLASLAIVSELNGVVF